MIYKGLTFRVHRSGIDQRIYTIDKITGVQVTITWPTGFTDYDRDVVESYLKTGIWVPVYQPSDFLKALKKHL